MDEMPVEDMRNWLSYFEPVFEEVHRANRSRFCHWSIMPESDENLDWFGISLHEMQQLRGVARLLGLGIRVAAYDKDFEKAAFYLPSGFKIAHDIGQCDSLVGGLVGLACASMMIDALVEVSQQPGAPNYHWAIVDLPNPICDVRESIRAELGMFQNHSTLRVFNNPENKQLSAKIKKLFGSS